MGRIIAVYGAIAGVIVVAGMFINIGFLADHGAMGMVAGYLSMLVALVFVFVGVKRYRDVNLGGVITFWNALGVGLGMAQIALQRMRHVAGLGDAGAQHLVEGAK